MASAVNSYSASDRLLHNSAFKSWSLMTSLSGIESRIYKKSLCRIEITKPVFVTALPRAGTTLLLELCVETREFASHTYRDMPFLLTPLFWDRFSGMFKRSDVAKERAHGDGMMISVDSPEAFEEIIWKGYWPSRYLRDRIVPCTEPDFPEFEDFFRDHMCKIIMLRGRDASRQHRYISKNNLNIARIGYIKKVFPDSIIVVPFRAPLQHASSMLRQHRNFTKIHEQDPFSSKYMQDIGHFDFGENLRPVDFDGWVSSEQTSDPDTLLFWVRYWIKAYRYLLSNATDHAHFFPYDDFCESPGDKLRDLGELLEINDIDSLMRQADRITAPQPYDIDVGSIPSDILHQAETLFEELLSLPLR